MVMDMGRDAEQDVVELSYRPAVEDFASALRARLRVSRAGRRQFWMIGVLTVFLLMEVTLLAAGDHDKSPGFVGALAFSCGILWLSPWLQARQFHRLAQRQGEFRATVTDAGVSLTTDNTTASVNWTAQPRYRENSRVFVLFSTDRNATGFTMLPKRGLRTPEDADRLRTILDRNATRV
ncbi:YcxB family protein [Streptomyces sp. NPDC020298]|uniref:YcxB family protein n=1 Tax=unclassified Streptomyces TaxID=2593676 RepID=UPI0033CD90BF